jgi:hypothetical protein
MHVNNQNIHLGFKDLEVRPIKDDVIVSGKVEQKLERLDGEVRNKVNDVFKQINKMKQEKNVEGQRALRNQIKKEINSIKKDLKNCIKGQSTLILAREQTTVVDKKAASDVIKVLHDLDKRLDSMQLEGAVVSSFVKKSNFQGQLLQLFEKFLPSALSELVNTARSKIFMGWQKDSEAVLQKKIDLLEDRKEELNNQKTKVEDQLARISTSKKIDHLNQQIESLQKKLDRISEAKEKGIQTRKCMKMIGGESIQVFDKSSNSTLDGMYLSADKFRETLKSAGGKVATIQLDTSNGLLASETLTPDQTSVTGFSFPVEEFEKGGLKEVFQLLGLQETGWDVHQEGDKLYILPGDDAQKLVKLAEAHEANCNTEEKEIDLKKSSDGGTVILTSGNKGVYEMHKKEMLAYLMQGMNVAAFNFAGYGESKGVPSGETLKSNMEAFYQHLKTHHPVEDKKILLKALCMSGGPAAALAARHPKMNICLDQSYADFKDVVTDQIKKEIDSFFSKKINNLDSKDKWVKEKKAFYEWANRNIQSLSHFVAKMVAPAWETKKEIAKVEGKVALILTNHDTLMTLDREIYQNYEAMAKAGKGQQVSLMSIEGKHGASWLDARQNLGFKYNNRDGLWRIYEDKYGQFISKLKAQDKPNPFEGLLDEIEEEIEKRKLDLADPNQVSNFQSLIKTMVNKWFPENKDIGFDFLQEAFPGIKGQYAGRAEMDHFLNKTQLKGNLFK